jgi:hypothetical protein
VQDEEMVAHYAATGDRSTDVIGVGRLAGHG